MYSLFNNNTTNNKEENGTLCTFLAFQLSSFPGFPGFPAFRGKSGNSDDDTLIDSQAYTKSYSAISIFRKCCCRLL